MGTFGWSYPPGAANDPNAPYNQGAPECRHCDAIADALQEGYPLCDEHDTPENRLEWEQYQYDDALAHHIRSARLVARIGGQDPEEAEREARADHIEKHGPRPTSDGL